MVSTLFLLLIKAFVEILKVYIRYVNSNIHEKPNSLSQTSLSKCLNYLICVQLVTHTTGHLIYSKV